MALNNTVGFSLILVETTVNRGPRPAAARSPLSRNVIRPVLGSIVMTTTSSAHRCMRRAGEPTIQGTSAKLTKLKYATHVP